MIETLSIVGLGAIGSADCEFDPGFTVITGETGAGKTMLLNGLALVRGQRGDAGLVTPGAGKAYAEARFRVANDATAAERVIEAGGEVDDGVVIVARSLGADGRTRAFAGGRSVPAGVLVEITSELVAVHGQHDQRRLSTPSYQRDALDTYAGTEGANALATYRSTWVALSAARTSLTEITTHARERAREAEGLRAGIAAIGAVDPKPSEDEDLRVRATRLGHVEDLRSALETASYALTDPAISTAGESADATSALSRASRALASVLSHDPALRELAERVSDLLAGVGDLGVDVSRRLDELDADPIGLDTIEARRAELIRLTRVYGTTIDEVLAWRSTAEERLLELDDDTERIDTLTAECHELERQIKAQGHVLRGVRSTAAAALCTSVSAELDILSMSSTRFAVVVGPAHEPGPHGLDTVEFALETPEGVQRPVASAASGGELSRVMLALEVVLAGSTTVPTLVFDEVDAGIGGRTAIEVGRRLAILARTTQVLVVTHLAQVAAFADRHLVVERRASGGSGEAITDPVSNVSPVVGDTRVAELARMLSGMTESSTAHEHAAELLELAGATVVPRDRTPQPTGRRPRRVSEASTSKRKKAS